jgi:hypothetical protein
MSSALVKVETDAPQAWMHRSAAAAFNQLRSVVRQESGVDFLARCGDIFRDAGFVSGKDGVANRSWHKTGRAFDYDQSSKALIIVSEVAAGKQFFRTYLLCSDQTGRLGVKRHLRDVRGGSSDSYVFDFTAAAQAQKFSRIPAWSGWQTHYNRREFWHYEMREGLSWAAAMAQISGSSQESVDTAKTLYGLNDKGLGVSRIQTALVKQKLLPASGVTGIFDLTTKDAVAKFQSLHKLAADGLVGPVTRAALLIANE